MLGAMVIDIGDPFFFILIVIEYWSSNLFNQIKNILCSAKEMVHHFILVHHGTPFYLFSDLLSRGKAVLSNFRVWMKMWCEKFRSHSQRRNPSQNRDRSRLVKGLVGRSVGREYKLSRFRVIFYIFYISEICIASM